MTPTKVTMTGPKQGEIHKLFDKEFKIIILKKLNTLQEKNRQ